MIYRFIILITIVAWMSSCQQDDYMAEVKSSTSGEETVPVSISFSSIDGLIDQSTGYEPMTRAERGDNVLKISNMYRAILIKEVGDKLIIDSIMTGIANKNQGRYGAATFKRGESFSNLDIELVPGKYHLVVFTGFNSLSWNKHIRKGGVIKDNTRDPLDTYACKYMLGKPSYSNLGFKTLAEEILTGKTEFTVNKTEDLHSLPDPTLSNLQITLRRNVTKFRIALHYLESSNGENFQPSSPPIIQANMEAVNGTKFCDGLDIWGDPWYDPVTPLTYMKYSVEGTSIYTVQDKGQYHISCYGSRVYAPYFLTEEGKDIEIELSNVTVLFQANTRTWKFDEYIIPITLKHNTIDGIVMKPGTYTDTNMSPPVTNMELEVDDGGQRLDGMNIFGNYFEIN